MTLLRVDPEIGNSCGLRHINSPCHSFPILAPEMTYYALARISSTETAFDLFFPEDILQLIQHFTNLQGRRSVNEWIDLIEEELQAYLKLMILAGMFRSQHESTN